jgi:hypothetical protein
MTFGDEVFSSGPEKYLLEKIKKKWMDSRAQLTES